MTLYKLIKHLNSVDAKFSYEFNDEYFFERKFDSQYILSKTKNSSFYSISLYQY